MGFRREELYGDPTARDSSSSPAVTPYRAGGSHRVTVARGASSLAPEQLPFEARALLVDNPSSIWYRVNGSRWIAPWTIGAVLPLDVPTAQLSIAALTPEGYALDSVGEDLVLVAVAGDLPPSPGLFVPAGAPAQLLTVTRTGWIVPEGGAAEAAWIAAPAADTRIVLVALHVAAELETGVSGRASQLRGMVRIRLQDDDGNHLAYAAVSPEQPSLEVVPFAQPGTVDAVDLIGQGHTGHGDQSVDVAASYYLQVT